MTSFNHIDINLSGNKLILNLLPALPHDSKTLVLNGHIAAEGQFPHQVSIAYREVVWLIDQCGGAIISENYVLTSALCLQKRLPEGVAVVAGTNDVNNKIYMYDVEKIIRHPLLNFHTKENDIALLKLKKSFDKVPKIQSIPLPTKNDSLKVGDVATVSGWGRNQRKIVSDSQLRFTSVVISDQNKCSKRYENQGPIHDTNVCAYDPHTPTGPCFRDEGGPLTVNGKLFGIVSWSIGDCADDDFPSIYTRVSPYLEWIKENAV
ncbi:trypsin-1-like [Prorops nasuta]|uniref:trypsin-1-like n=1 Tax=Prorops nasuta TaxID=863751 RepID=UPI0034CEE7F3